jgi:hypothetical protein
MWYIEIGLDVLHRVLDRVLLAIEFDSNPLHVFPVFVSTLELYLSRALYKTPILSFWLAGATWSYRIQSLT